MRMLKTGDPCPCCGQPIKARDPDLLRLLTYIRDRRRLPSLDEMKTLDRGDWEKRGASDE